MFIALNSNSDYKNNIEELYDIMSELMMDGPTQLCAVANADTYEVKGRELFLVFDRNEVIGQFAKLKGNLLLGTSDGVYYSLGHGCIGYHGDLRHGGRIDDFTPQRLFNICVSGSSARNTFLSNYNGKVSFAGITRDSEMYVWAGTDHGKFNSIEMISTRFGVFATDSPFFVKYIVDYEEGNDIQVLPLPTNKLVQIRSAQIETMIDVERA